jgi:[ribosomal protein S18]-alanine N-acetyltransferase
MPPEAGRPRPEALAALHARCFGDAPRAWSAEEFAALLASPTTVLAARSTGFALGRVVASEAELLTLAVAPEARRRGLGRTLMTAFEAVAAARGSAEVFLEVAETNVAARALYSGAGYCCAGFRRDYYRADGRRISALVLRKVLAGE